jgi:LDH2 family malate/lactate/ureidoglycolate dehydrogenase
MVKPDAFAGADLFGQYMAQWTQTYLTAGGEQARLPGHRGDAMEHAGRRDGIALPAAIVRELQVLAKEFGIHFPE